MKKYFITTPIFYVNAAPHLGHLYTAVVADASARFTQLRHGRTPLLCTGTDEHGTKVRQAAAAAGVAPLSFCDRVSGQYRAVFADAHIAHDRFIRTTADYHRCAVQHFWKLLDSRGHIKKGSYSGWYSVPDESFLTSSQVLETEQDGRKVTVSAESGHEVTWSEEDNYIFPMSRVQDDLRYWANHELDIQPAKFGATLRTWLESDLPDLSISRPLSRLDWGIPVPDDDQQVVYVWLDALVNYLTVAGYPDKLTRWPPDTQVFGKDILKFHGVYWPALLLAAGLEPPRQLLCHSHWTIDGSKMAKSRGNVVAAADAVERYTADGVRYFLLREGTPHSDANFSHRKASLLLNAELADTLGNLLSRSTGQRVNPTQRRFSADAAMCCEEGASLLHAVTELPLVVADEFEYFNFYRGLEAIQAVLRATNQYVQMKEPWVLRKSAEREAELHACLAVAMETLRVAAILLQPVVPRLAARILDKLGVAADARTWHHAREHCSDGGALGTGSAVLFQRLPTD